MLDDVESELLSHRSATAVLEQPEKVDSCGLMWTWSPLGQTTQMCSSGGTFPSWMDSLRTRWVSNDSVAGCERTQWQKPLRLQRRLAGCECGTFPNGIVSVSATDKSTGKKQSSTIRCSGGISDADVEKMVQEFQEQLSNTDDRMATLQKSVAELEDSVVKTTER